MDRLESSERARQIDQINKQRPAGELDRIITVGCVKLAQVKGASAQAAFGAGNPP